MCPRKMRIESLRILCVLLCLRPISKCVLVKWGLKDEDAEKDEKVNDYFKMCPRKMRIESVYREIIVLRVV